MIDKTIPYFNVLMRYDGPLITTPPQAPDGYRFRSYQEGDEFGWAQMEVDNLDFDTYDNAVKYFRQKYLSDPEKLKERFIGLENQNGALCGAVICWSDAKDEATVSTVHWLITAPAEQGRGLGSALVRMLLYRFSQLDALPIYLHTQPWSYPAIGIYSKCGFRLLRQDSFRGYENQSAQALEVLQGLMEQEKYNKLKSEMI